MKKFTFIFIIFFNYIFCQLNYPIGEEGNPNLIYIGLIGETRTESLEDIRKVTFEPGNMNLHFEDGSQSSESLEDITQITFSNHIFLDQSLPVNLSDFYAIQNGNNVVLYWNTASEVNNSGFELERKNLSSIDWKTIAFIKGNGNSSFENNYTYSDKDAGKLNALRYRLKQINFDGSYEYSPEISVKTIEEKLPTQFMLHNNYPNPFNPTTTISYDIIKDDFVEMRIYNIKGQEVENLVNESQKPGYYSIRFDASNMASGVYFCRLISGNNVKIIKMLLVK